jgi:hypothetical protein
MIFEAMSTHLATRVAIPVIRRTHAKFQRGVMPLADISRIDGSA